MSRANAHLNFHSSLVFHRTDFTNASSVLAAQHRARATGGMETDTLDLLSSCRPTGSDYFSVKTLRIDLNRSAQSNQL